MSRQCWIVSLLLTGLLVFVSFGEIVTAHDVGSLSENLLLNGSFDDLRFEWFYPNHFVAGGWERWWIHGSVLPEFDDVAKPGGAREHIYIDGGHAQVYFKWGDTYTAGIYQVINGLTPCRPYRLTMHGRTHSVEDAQPGSRIGLDPLGERLTLSADDSAVHDSTPLHRTVWSREQTELFKWEELEVTAEPLGDRLTAILYASPRPSSRPVDHYYDTFWDAGALRPATYESGRLPAPTQATTGFIDNVQAAADGNEVAISWDLGGPGASQVWYTLITPTTAAPTIPMTHTIYMPLTNRFSLTFDQETALDFATTEGEHTVTVTDLQSGQIVNYIVLARRLSGGACITEYAGPFAIQVDR